MKRTYAIGGVEFVRDEEQLHFRLSWPTLLLQSFLYILLIPFIGYFGVYSLALPLLPTQRSPQGHTEIGALLLALLIESVLISFLVGRILDRVRPYILDLRDRSFRHGALRLGSLDDILTITVLQRNRAYSFEFTLRPDSRTVLALRLSSLKGASAAVREIATFLGMESQNKEEERTPPPM